MDEQKEKPCPTRLIDGSASLLLNQGGGGEASGGIVARGARRAGRKCSAKSWWGRNPAPPSVYPASRLVDSGRGGVALVFSRECSSSGNRSATRCSARDASAMAPEGFSPSRKQAPSVYRLAAACQTISAESSGIEMTFLGLGRSAGSAPAANSAAVRKPRHAPTDSRPKLATVRKRGPHMICPPSVQRVVISPSR